MQGLLVTLLSCSIFVGIPAALIAAWQGHPVVLCFILAAMLLIALLSSNLDDPGIGPGPGKTGMALVILGPWAVWLTVATTLAAAILYVVGDSRRDNNQSEDETE